jgi:membrane protein required for colicin V production
LAVLDWIVVALLLGSLLLGLWRGLVYEVLSVLSWIAAFLLAQWFAPQVGDWLPMGEGTAPALKHAAGFVVVFVGALFGGGLVAWLVKKLVEAIGLKPVDRTLGALFGLVRGGVLVLAVAVVVHLTGQQAAAWWQESISGGVATAALRGMKPVVPLPFATYLPD